MIVRGNTKTYLTWSVSGPACVPGDSSNFYGTPLPLFLSFRQYGCRGYSGSDLRTGRRFILCSVCPDRLSGSPTLYCVPETLFPGVEWPGSEANHSYLMPRLRVELYPRSCICLMACTGTFIYTFLLLLIFHQSQFFMVLHCL